MKKGRKKIKKRWKIRENWNQKMIMSETKKVIKMEEAQNNKESYTTVYIV